MNFSDKLKELRLKNNETQQELANKLNIQEIRKDEVTTTPHLLKLI